MGIKNTNRHVKSRIFFSSESHLHAFLNILRYAHLHKKGVPACDERVFDGLDELNYLSHIVLKLFEVTDKITNVTKNILRVYFSKGMG